VTKSDLKIMEATSPLLTRLPNLRLETDRGKHPSAQPLRQAKLEEVRKWPNSIMGNHIMVLMKLVEGS
ncbi:MAG TPA: hypothetical protein VJ044_12005, partial [Candidatus Hodarchaeales archaeon]|nr:hypothetical protein [Candidatus Hodarchaeales archaeon]